MMIDYSEKQSADPVLERVMSLDERYYMPVFGRRTPICIAKGEGAYLIDTAGRRYLDLIGGIAVNVLGHAHPALVKAICGQASSVIHCSNYYYNIPQAELAARLSALSGLQDARVFLCNSGAEANEAALKLARAYFYHKGQPRSKIISALNSFHGRTLATVTATGQTKYSEPFAPLPEGFIHVPYNDEEALKKVVDEKTCAVILEVIQGESGVILAHRSYLEQAERLCRQTDARFIIDEVQTGMGRTGKFMAYEHHEIKPDIVTLAKGLAGGVPIGAMVANGETAPGFHPGDHGSTFGGNPLACAAALAVLDTYEESDLVAKAKRTGEQLIQSLTQLSERQTAILEVRGMGLMIGIELRKPCAPDVKAALLEAGYLVGSVGQHMIRLLPPLILDESNIPPFISALERILPEVS